MENPPQKDLWIITTISGDKFGISTLRKNDLLSLFENNDIPNVRDNYIKITETCWIKAEYIESIIKDK